VHRDTVLDLMIRVGAKCERLMQELIKDVPVKDVQADELWSYVNCKEKRKTTDDPRRGDAYCFVVLERGTKMVLAWHLGRRTARDTVAFTEKLNNATSGHFQLTTDGFRAYPDAVNYRLGTRVHFARLIKVYREPWSDEHRYSPADVVGPIPSPVCGYPDPERICTSRFRTRPRVDHLHHLG
jgi:IS1 family transposase